jgi:thiol:disulfide interchange protein DsbD
MKRPILFLPLLMWLVALAAPAAEPLDPEQAYRFSARAIDAGTVEARWQIADGYYLYRQKFRFSAEPAAVKLGDPVFPTGEGKEDEFFGKVEIYHKDVRIRIPVDTGGADSLLLKVVSQGCWDQGICYPPTPQQVRIKLISASPPAAASSEPAARVAAADSAPATDESSRVASLLRHGSFWLILASFFGFGLLLCLTPCMLPMVPILSGIIVNHGHAVTHGRAFWLSLAYVLGMAATYAAVGVAAGYSGTLLSSALQNAWVLGSFALVFVVLSLSMFGFYELQLPSTLQSRLSESANRRGGSIGAIAAMGAVSAVIVGPCVAAPLAGALLYIAQTGDAALGGSALFAMALGMGAPLLLVGLFSRSLLPKSGPWMDAIKKFFGVVLLGTALWLVSPVLPTWVQMLGWSALLIVPAIFMRAIDPLPAHSSGWTRFWKGLGVLMLLAGMAMLAGVLGGSRDPLHPLNFLAGAKAGEVTAPAFQNVKSVADLDDRLSQAGKQGRRVMLDFYADWCVSCKEMEKFTFTDDRVRSRLDGLTLLRANVTANDEDDKALMKRFGLFGPPGIIFFGRDGREIEGVRVVGYQPADEFLASLGRVPD